MLMLTPRAQSYPWGSRSLIAEMKGEPPANHPEAELWYGIHPGGPAAVDNVPLGEIIAKDPEFHLGIKCQERFGDQLPYLLKLLAAGEPLSLQAHPSLEQAREGYARENARGLPLDAPDRNYRDDNHKPELIVALTPFYAMAGFRPFKRTLELFGVLNCPTLDRYVTIADINGGESENLRALFTTWITIPSTARKELIDDIIAAARRVVAAGQAKQWIIETLQNLIKLEEFYPGDAGVLGALLLNFVTIAPGDAIYLDAGNLHAYCYGLGVEIMASSDNVLRGGLTAKHVDVPELVKVLNFNSIANPSIGSNNGLFEVPNDEFSLQMVTVAGKTTITSAGPRVILCTGGEVTVHVGDEVQTLTPTQAVWVAAAEANDIGFDGQGQAFIASVGC